ncbi:MAG: DGQHR domain-containing protein [Melioribacteraceae bacterium]
MVKRTKRKKRRLTDQEKEQNLQKREIRNLLKNIGFSRIPRIDGKGFEFKGRTSEMDDIFYLENILLITEYTIGKPGEHLLKKNYFYNHLNENKKEFIEFLLSHEKFTNFQDYFKDNIKGKYTINQLQTRVLYCSKKTISNEHKEQVKDVVYFDYHIVKYFESLAKVIKKSSKYEFFDFLGVPFAKVGDNVLNSANSSQQTYSGHILPEENSSFKEGFKIVSFYIDAESLLKRAYVLRQNGWREKSNIGHYQRMFIQSKIRGMRKYLHERERVFINNIITSLSVDKIKLYDSSDNLLKIDSKGNFINPDTTTVTPAKIEIFDQTNIIGIIDGQHRTYAYHEGDDIYEPTISKYRKIQNLLVTGILFPKDEPKQSRLKFEANLFLEINANQANANSQLKQEIELMINPFSTVSIAKNVLNKLNQSGPLVNNFEEFWYEKGKLKTVSIVSYGLKPLLKLDDIKNKDSLFAIWPSTDKSKLKAKNNTEYDLLDEYIDFSTEKIRDIIIAFKSKIGNAKWRIDRTDPNAILNVTTINGILNTLRLIIQNGKINTTKHYQTKLANIVKFPFKNYKSSQYRKMGQDIYDKYFN